MRGCSRRAHVGCGPRASWCLLAVPDSLPRSEPVPSAASPARSGQAVLVRGVRAGVLPWRRRWASIAGLALAPAQARRLPLWPLARSAGGRWGVAHFAPLPPRADPVGARSAAGQQVFGRCWRRWSVRRRDRDRPSRSGARAAGLGAVAPSCTDATPARRVLAFPFFRCGAPYSFLRGAPSAPWNGRPLSPVPRRL